MTLAQSANLHEGWRRDYIEGLLIGVENGNRTVDYALAEILGVISIAEENARQGITPRPDTYHDERPSDLATFSFLENLASAAHERYGDEKDDHKTN